MVNQHLSNSQARVCARRMCPQFTVDSWGEGYCKAVGKEQGYDSRGKLTRDEITAIPKDCPNDYPNTLAERQR